MQQDRGPKMACPRSATLPPITSARDRTMPEAIRALSFDLDDTLWDIWPCIERAEARLHDWLLAGYPRIAEQFDALALRRLCSAEVERDPAIAHDRSLIRRRGLARAAEHAGYAGFALDEAFEVFFAARNQVEFFADALPVLERLAVQYPLVALSNGNADLGRIGIAHLFAFHLSSAMVGTQKPHPAMFEQAVARLGLPPAAILHIGDDPEHDVEGARAAGLRAVWVRRGARDWPDGLAPPEFVVDDLHGLEALLVAWPG